MAKVTYGRLTVTGSENEMGKEAAQRIASLIRGNNAKGRPTVLGLATGSTPETVYAELVRMHHEEGLSFKDVITFNLDEYYPVTPDHALSYRRYMNEKLFDHININKNNTHIPDGTACDAITLEQRCKDYEQAIRDAGGIDLQLLGIGPNGHIGFNEPEDLQGTHWSQLQTRRVDLSEATIKANHLEGTGITQAITMGMNTILNAKTLLLLAKGAGKADILAKTFGGEAIDTTIPAGILAADPRCQVILEKEAAEGLKEKMHHFQQVTLGM